jgi:hypothetical protein
MASTIVAVPTIVTPAAVSPSDIPLGFVQAPPSQILPPLARNSAIKSARGVRPFETTPSAPPLVPSHTASMVQTTVDSIPAAAEGPLRRDRRPRLMKRGQAIEPVGLQGRGGVNRSNTSCCSALLISMGQRDSGFAAKAKSSLLLKMYQLPLCTSFSNWRAPHPL